MWPDPDAEMDLDGVIEGWVQSYSEHFVERWGLDANEPPEGLEWESWYELLGLNQAAQQLVRAALHLYRPSKMGRSAINLPMQLAAAAEAEREQIKEMVAQVKELGTKDQDWGAIEAFLHSHLPDPEGFKERFFRIAIQVELADAALPSVHTMSQRILKLLDHLTHVTDSRVVGYLERVARCYVMGMSAEMAVMCRSVLEAAFKARLPEEYMRRVRRLGPSERVPLAMWIDEAEGSALFDRDTTAGAVRIRVLGSNVAHGENPSEIDADQLLTDLSRAVRALSPPR